MSRLILDDPKRVGDWVGPKAYRPDGYGDPGEDFQAVGVENPDGDLVGGMIFTDFDGNNVTLHLAITNPAYVHRSFYQYCHQYALIWMGCERITAVVIDGHKRMERLMAAMYFKKEGVVRRGWKLPDGTVVDQGIWGCLREDCKHLPKEYRHAGPLI
jgi:RimJ/RimL family protein N-acetyltransferase